jgi:hypothetical protein
MKEIFIVMSFFFICIIHTKAAKVPGLIINHKDTQRVVFVGSYDYYNIGMQYSLTYYNALNKKMTVYPENATEIIMYFKNGTGRLLSRVDAIGAFDKISPGDMIFLYLISDGKLKWFKYQEDYGKSTRSFNILQKENGPIFRVPLDNSFQQSLIDYFSNCPDLVAKLQSKEFSNNNDMNAIVQYYDAHCSNKIIFPPNSTNNSIPDLNININVDSIINK